MLRRATTTLPDIILAVVSNVGHRGIRYPRLGLDTSKVLWKQQQRLTTALGANVHIVNVAKGAVTRAAGGIVSAPTLGRMSVPANVVGETAVADNTAWHHWICRVQTTAWCSIGHWNNAVRPDTAHHPDGRTEEEGAGPRTILTGGRKGGWASLYNRACILHASPVAYHVVR
jgi:hypothetical protein